MGKKNEIVFVLDRSGSMIQVKDDAIGGFNQFVADQKKNDPETRMTLVQFNHRYQPQYESIKLSKVKELDESSYIPDGWTALLDAIGKTLVNAMKRRKDKKGKTVVAILTDGLENASEEYKKDAVKTLIEECQDKLDWTFFFLGANVDAFSEASGLGIPTAHAATFQHTGKGTRSVYAAASMGAMAAFDDDDDDFNLSETLDKIEEESSS